jgi:hypothetical protein
MTFTYDTTGPIKKIIASWTSDDAAGTASGTTNKVSGYLLRGVTDPGATAPTANYDITISDEESVNVLGNCVDDLVDRHTSTTESVDFVIGAAGTYTTGARPAVCDVLTIAVANAGNSKVGQIVLYVDGEIG